MIFDCGSLIIWKEWAIILLTGLKLANNIVKLLEKLVDIRSPGLTKHTRRDGGNVKSRAYCSGQTRVRPHGG